MSTPASHDPNASGDPNVVSWYDADGAPARLDLETCIHCGLCMTACPTYRELKIEPDSPRGRIYLMRGLSEGRIAPDDDVVAHLDNCLDCRACETVCPAGVPYSRMLEATRAQFNRRVVRGSPMRLAGEFVLNHVMPDRGRLHLLADLLRLAQVGPFAPIVKGAAHAGLLPPFAKAGLALTPPIEARGDRPLERVAASLPHGASVQEASDGLVFRPPGAPKLRVAFHTTCVMDALFSPLNRETVRVMVLAGIEVRVPRAQTCCGALHAHAGLRERAMQLASANVAAFADDCDFVVSHSAGCGAALREAGHLLHGEPRAQAAEAFSAKVRDVSEVLAHVGLPQPPAPLHSGTDAAKPLRVAYHDPCHLAHAQRVREAPRRLLRALPGVELIDLPNSDWCCGSAGIYNLTHPDMAQAQLDRKLGSVDAVAPEVVIASNPGCLLHMRRGEHARGGHVRMAHLVELLGEAFPPPASRHHA